MQNHTETKVHAGFFVRLVAFGIDSLIAAVVVSMVKSPFSLAASMGVDFLKANFIFQYSFLDVLDYVSVAAYFVLLTYFTHTTPGKALMRLEVVTVDKEWTIWNVLYRETIGRFFSSMLCIGYFAVIVSQKKQGFHDMLCDTYVVYKGMMPKVEPVPVMAGPIVNPAGNPVGDSVENPVENLQVVGEATDKGETLVIASVVTQTNMEDAVQKVDSIVESPVHQESPVTYNHDQMNPDCSNLSQLQDKDSQEL